MGGPDAEPGPTRITITSCMANLVGTSQPTAEALTGLRKEYGFDTDKCKVSSQDFDVVPLYLAYRVERISVVHMTATDAMTKCSAQWMLLGL